MKHIFIINPKAGKSDHEKETISFLKKYDGIIDYEVYVTKYKGDGERFVKDYLSKASADEKIRFYACGGDGTMNEVVNGCFSHKNVELASYAIGSGNDFSKNFGDLENFKNLDKLINGTPKLVDCLRVNGRICMNIANCGFDGEVTYLMQKFKKLPLMSGPFCYYLSAFTALLFKVNQYMKVKVDGKVIHDSKAMLIAIANGYCYGGGFYCCPEAKVDDGLIDICLLNKISRFKAAPLVKVFKAGKHVNNPKLSKTVTYVRGKTVELESNKKLAYAIDGEVFKDKKLSVSILPSSVEFVVPALEKYINLI